MMSTDTGIPTISDGEIAAIDAWWCTDECPPAGLTHRR